MVSTEIFRDDTIPWKGKNIMNEINNRYEFTLIFDVENRDFNEDICSDNDFMIDLETGYSVVTDLYLKRKIRRAVSHSYDGEEPYKILFKAGKPLDQKTTDFSRNGILISYFKDPRQEFLCSHQGAIRENFLDFLFPHFSFHKKKRNREYK